MGTPAWWATHRDIERVYVVADRVPDPVRAVSLLLSLVPVAAPHADGLLARAEAAAALVAPKDTWVPAVTSVVRAAVAAGRADQALDIAAGTADVGVREHLRVVIAGGLAAAGDVAGALTAADLIANERVRERAVVAVAAHADADQAAALADTLPGPARRVAALLSAGLVEDAKAIATRIPWSSARGPALAAVAVALAGRGDVDGAITLVKMTDGRRRRDSALLAMVRSAPVAATSIGSRDKRDKARQSLTRTAARAGRFGAALDLAAGLTYPMDRASADSDIAITAAGGGQLLFALELLDTVPQNYYEVSAVLRVAVATARRGPRELAIETIIDPVAIHRALGEPHWRKEEVMAGAAGAAVAGRLDHVTSIARSFGDSYNETRTLREAARAAARAGRPESAVALAGRITDATARAGTEQEIAVAAAGRGDTDAAVDIAERIADPRTKASALAAVSCAAVRAGRPIPLLLNRIEAAADSLPRVDRPAARSHLAEAVAYAGRIEDALSIMKDLLRPEILTRVARAAAWLGRVDEALAFVRPSAPLAVAAAMGGHRDRALDIAAQLAPQPRIDTVIDIAGTAAAVGDLTAAHRIIATVPTRHQNRALRVAVRAAVEQDRLDDATEIALTLLDNRNPTPLVRAAAITGDLGRATTIAAILGDNRWRDQDRALALAATITADRGDLNAAIAVAATIADPYLRMRSWAHIACDLNVTDARTAADRFLPLAQA